MASERLSQRVVLQLSSEIMYFLWVGYGRDRVSVQFRIYPARSRTFCEWAMGETESMRDSEAIQQDHLLPLGSR